MDKKTVFHKFNEGVTDIIAFEVFKKYCEQTNLLSPPEVRKFLDKFKERDLFYYWERHLVDMTVLKLARQTSKDPKKIWQDISDGAFKGDDLNNSELRDVLNNHLGQEFMKGLEKDDIPKIAKKKPRSYAERHARKVKAFVKRNVRNINH